MQNRITEKHLNGAVEQLNDKAGIKNPACNVVGSYLLSMDYGGYSLDKVTNTSGGCTSVFNCWHISKRELYNLICAKLNTI
jgi:hypothetical protein